MIDMDEGAGVGAGRVDRWRRARDVVDDYDAGVLCEQLADELANELSGLGPRPHRLRRTAARPGPQPSRPAATATAARPRLSLVRGGA